MKLDIIHQFDTNSEFLVLNKNSFCPGKKEAQKWGVSFCFDADSPVPKS